MRIGVIDSGIGGLTTLYSLASAMNGCEFIYYADFAFCPYGEKNEKQLCDRVNSIASFLAQLKIDALVLACNTATSVAIEELRKNFRFDIIGLEPAIKPAVLGGAKNIALLSTKITSNGVKFKKLVEKTNAVVNNIETYNLATLIEDNICNLSNITSQLDEIIDSCKNCDAIVLGCTHYIFAKPYLQEKSQIKVYDGNAGLSRKICTAFNLPYNFNATISRFASVTFYSSTNEVNKLISVWGNLLEKGILLN